MPPKPPQVERSLIVTRDHRRKYGARITFQVLRSAYLGEMENVTLLLPTGAIATLRPGRSQSREAGVRYELDIEGFPTAALAEEAGMNAAQAVLLAAISMDFGVRLNYHSHEPPTVFDRTVSTGSGSWSEGFASWPQAMRRSRVTDAFSHAVKDRRLILSMELFAAASLESNDRARFVMAVSAFEPLAEQIDLGPEVAADVTRACADLDSDPNIPARIRQSLRGRVLKLRQESVRQALHRLCEAWFPGDRDARDRIDFAYSLRSQILHDGRLADLDIELAHEARTVATYLRQIYAKEYSIALRMPAAI